MWASPVSPRHADPRCTGTGSSPPSRQMVQHGGCTHTSVAGHHRHGHQLFVAVVSPGVNKFKVVRHFS